MREIGRLKERDILRAEINKQIKAFKRNGGKIQRIKSEPVQSNSNPADYSFMGAEVINSIR